MLKWDLLLEERGDVEQALDKGIECPVDGPYFLVSFVGEWRIGELEGDDKSEEKGD